MMGSGIGGTQLPAGLGRFSDAAGPLSSLWGSWLTGFKQQDNPNLIDNSETVYISSLALLKMLRHGRAGVPWRSWV